MRPCGCLGAAVDEGGAADNDDGGGGGFVDDAKANDPPDNDFGGVDEDEIGVMVKLPRLKGLVIIGGGKEEFA